MIHPRSRAITGTIVTMLAVAVASSALAGSPASSMGRASASTPRSPAELPSSYGRVTRVDTLVWERLSRGGSVDALVTLDAGSTLASARTRAGGDSRALLRVTVPVYRGLKDGLRARMPGLRVLQDYRTLPVVLVRIGSRGELARLATDPGVLGVAADERDRVTLGQSLPLIGQPSAAAAGHTGAGTSVAVLDTGINYNHSAFGTCGGGPGSPGCRVLVATDFAPDDGELDAHGHGTNVGGIVAGTAPGAGLLALDVFDGNGAFVSDQIEALNFTIANQATYNVRGINMSLGNSTQNITPCSGDARESAFANARAAGILPVVSSGNARVENGTALVGVSRPACIPGALPVGAVYDADVGSRSYTSCSDTSTQADKITCFSQVWTNPMVLAPGATITAAGTTMSGTSMAAPHVAGAVAVLQDAAGVTSDGTAEATPAQVESALLNSGPSIFDPLVGQSFRRLDLPAAIAALGGPPPPTTTTAPPTTTATATTTVPPTTTATATTTPPTTTATVTTTPTTTTIPTTTATTTSATVTTSSTTTPPPPSCTLSGTGDDDVLVGTPGDDVLCGKGGGDVLLASGGEDVFVGGPGFDWVSLENATGAGTIDLAAGTATAPGTHVVLLEIEGGIGTRFDDVLTGDAGDNDFFGLPGDDALRGGGGFDYVRYDGAAHRLVVDLGAGSGQGQGRDILDSVEAAVGGEDDDRLTGNPKVNRLYGFNGDDVLRGAGKEDALFGGRDDDRLFGGSGNDRCVGGPGSDTVSSC